MSKHRTPTTPKAAALTAFRLGMTDELALATIKRQIKGAATTLADVARWRTAAIKGGEDLPTNESLTVSRKMYGIDEVAAAVDVHERVIRQAVAAGTIPVPDAWLARGPVWQAVTIDSWIAEQRKAAVAALAAEVWDEAIAEGAIVPANGKATAADHAAHADELRRYVATRRAEAAEE